MTETLATDLAQDARLRVMAARVIAQSRWPYVASMLFQFRLVEVTDGSLSTMAVDEGWRLYYAPSFVEQETPEALATVLLHECLHCMHHHGQRFTALNRPPEDHPMWNCAGDAVINEVLDEARMPWTETVPVRFSALRQYGVTSDMTTEAAFFAMVDYRESNPDSDPMDGDDCGSVSGGDARPYEISRDDAQAPAMRGEQQATIRDRVAHDVVAHHRDRGEVPQGLLRWAEGLLHPKVDWRDALASRLRRDLSLVAGRRDYVYTRPSRRQEAMRRAGSPVILPAMRQPAPPRVVTVLDTSGSVDTDELRGFLGEVSGITRAAGVVSVGVICCDARAYPLQWVRRSGDVSSIRLEGGGGTDMAVGIDAASRVRPTPHIIVVFTDGHTPWPEGPLRGVDSIIVVLTDEAQRAGIPDSFRVISLN